MSSNLNCSDNSSNNSSNILRKFKMNETARYSITRPYEAKQISNYIMNTLTSYGKNTRYCTITDGTAGVGGDSINFSKYFDYVNAIEIDGDTYSLLLQNLNDFGISNIKSYNKDYIKIMNSIEQDIVYMDPPWGGVKYKDYKEVGLMLSNVDIGTIIKELLENNREQGKDLIIFMKAPLNVRKTSFSRYIKDTIKIFNKIGIESFLLFRLEI